MHHRGLDIVRVGAGNGGAVGGEDPDGCGLDDHNRPIGVNALAFEVPRSVLRRAGGHITAHNAADRNKHLLALPEGGVALVQGGSRRRCRRSVASLTGGRSFDDEHRDRLAALLLIATVLHHRSLEGVDGVGGYVGAVRRLDGAARRAADDESRELGAGASVELNDELSRRVLHGNITLDVAASRDVVRLVGMHLVLGALGSVGRRRRSAFGLGGVIRTEADVNDARRGDEHNAHDGQNGNQGYLNLLTHVFHSLKRTL